MDTLQFVDAISASPTVRLDLNNENPWALKYEGTDLSPPDLRQAWAQTLLADGAELTSAAFNNRRLRLRLELATATPDAAATAMQALWRELDRPTNLLKWQPGTSLPVFFRTIRSSSNRVTEIPGGGTLRLVDVEIEARPFALGLKETLPQVTVYNDPAEGTTLNANPFFETDASNWVAAGCTIARSTVQKHEGAASLLVTPDGVTATATARSEMVSATAGVTYRASEWVRCAVARSVAVNINWYDSSSVFISSSFSTTSVAANTWTLLDWADEAPGGTGKAQITAFMTGTPPASDTLRIDEARLRQSGGAGGMCFDVTGVKGDVPAPLNLRFEQGTLTSTGRQSLIAVRRRGTPSAAPFALQAEASAGGTDTTLGAANDPAFSGPGQNYVRTTFATNAGMVQRFSISTWPTTPSVDARGTYRVLARVRKTVAADTISMQLVYGNNAGTDYLGEVTTLRANSTDVHYADLGLVQLPIGHDPVTDGLSGVELAVRGIFLAVYAQRVAGTGSLDMDLALLLVPADDRLLLVGWAPDSVATAHILDSQRGIAYAVGSSGEVRTIRSPEMAGGPPLVSPGVTNRITFMQDTGYKSAGGDVLSNSTAITPHYYPRYLYTRPATT